jgi:hypothetical protein
MSTSFPVTDPYIQLDFQGLSLKFFRSFLDLNLPRQSDETIEIIRSAYGTPAVMRRVTEDYWKWNFTTLIGFDTQAVLDAMYFHSNWMIQTKTGNPWLLLTDSTRQITEFSPRTRAKPGAPFDFVNTISGNVNYVQYFAKYYVLFDKPPEYTKIDEKLKVQLSFKEVNLKVPTSLDG